MRKLLSTDRGDRSEPESEFVVSVSDEVVKCVHPDGKEEAVRWDELGVVIIETNDTGLWGCDVWWLLVSREADCGCMIPQGATGEKGLLTRLQELPGFDNEALISAMSSVENKRFICWKPAGN